MAQVEANASVILFRASVVGGVVGTFTQVNEVNATAGGTVTIADLNNNQGLIADGSYVYEAQQVDLAGNPGPITSTSTTITIDSTPPLAPAAPMLDPASDTGVSNTDGITRITVTGFPIFNISGIEGLATVQLFRLAPGSTTPVLVGSAVAASNATSVTIVDNTSPTADGVYTYTALQIDVAHNTSSASLPAVVSYETAQPPTPSSLTLDPASQTGASSPPTTSVRNPTFDVNVTVSGAASNSSLSLVRDGKVVAQTPYNITTATAIASIDFNTHLVTGIAVNIGGSGYTTAPTVVLTGGGFTTAATATATIATGGSGYSSASPPTVTIIGVGGGTGATATASVNSSGVVTGITITNAGSGYTSAVTVLIAPPTSSSGTTATGTALVNSSGGITGIMLTGPVSSIMVSSGGSGYTSAPTVTLVGGLTITDPGSVSDGSHNYQAFLTDLAGNKGALSKSLAVTFAPDPPGAPVLDPTSDSGNKGDNITNVTSGLLFNVSTATPGDTVELFRNGTLVGSRLGSGPITDPGPLLSQGVYVYTAQQLDQFGTLSLPSAPLNVTILTKATAPTQIRLDPLSDSGVTGDGVTSVTSNLMIDVFGITAGSTVLLFRGGTQVASQLSTVAGKVTISDPGPLLPGTYQYTAKQLDGAGNPSALSPSVSIQIVTAASVITPTLALDQIHGFGNAG